ncbi:hypothetical protein JHK85_009891 [Glycine max]|nr:hypothetical protein JHK85_009891 [Glycine max]KAG5065902.1 hypothetical protein JHK86_009633 [Glycine max]
MESRVTLLLIGGNRESVRLHMLLGSSFLTRVAQVLVVAFRKKNASFGSSGFIGLYEVPGRQPPIKGSRKITHVDEVAVSS